MVVIAARTGVLRLSRKRLPRLWGPFDARPSGGANNPLGPGGKSGKAADDIVNVDNVHGDKGERPTGNTAAAGLRKLQKAAAEGNELARSGNFPE